MKKIQRIIAIVMLLTISLSDVVVPLASSNQLQRIDSMIQKSATQVPPKPTAAPVQKQSDPKTVTFKSKSAPAALALADMSAQKGSANFRVPITVHKMDKVDFSADENVVVSINNPDDEAYEAVLTDSQGTSVPAVVYEVEKGTETELQLAPTTQFKPGKFTLTITDRSGKTTEQDFSWGVLALNSDKATYKPGETAAISMAVLDDNGAMVCDASVTLEIRDPEGKKQTLSTKGNQIITNPECTKKEFTLKPDYETTYQLDREGEYTLSLSAITANGTHTIVDAIQVQTESPFIVKRTSATRLYPPLEYPMNFEITANRDFKGVITETVPEGFIITPAKSGASYHSMATAYLTRDDPADKLGQQVLGASTSKLHKPFEGDYGISQGFGTALTDIQLSAFYSQYGLSGHDGIDFALPTGTPLYAVDDGNIIWSGPGDYGITIIIQHAWGRSYYGHLSKTNVGTEAHVTKGSLIGYSGNTGESTGPHLHFGMKPEHPDLENGYAGKIDPMPYLSLDGELGAAETLDLTFSTAVLSASTAATPPKTASNAAETPASGPAVQSPSITPEATPVASTGAQKAFTVTDEMISKEVVADQPPTQEKVKVIKWAVDVKKGEEIDLSYTWKAPQVSPQFYMLGPVKFFSYEAEDVVYEEKRQWQLAADGLGDDWYNKEWQYRKELSLNEGASVRTVFITSGTSWTVPTDWDDNANTVEVIGGGGGGGRAMTSSPYRSGAGGGGGAYSAVSNLNLTPGGSVTVQVGSGGSGGASAGSAGAAGGDTWFNGASLGASSVGAKGGSGGNGGSTTTPLGGAGGAAGSGVGTTRNSGGTGGNGSNNAGEFNGGGGGAGAAGPHGNGGNGGNGSGGSSNSSAAGGGGGGADGGSTGGNASGGTAGTGGNNRLGSGGGSANNDGSNGGGGGGGTGSNTGGDGGAGEVLWTQTSDNSTAGPGGGAGGSDSVPSGTTGTGGFYGGGGAGTGDDASVAGGVGRQGIIVVTYTSTGVSGGVVGDAWCNDTTGITCTTSWTNRRKITFDNSASAGTLTDFPVLVKVNSSRIDYSKTMSGGEDIRFVDASDPNTVLAHEIETWNESGDSYVWVKVPALASGTSDYIYMYYGNASASDGQAPSSVWNSAYQTVWHMKEATTFADSTSVGNDGTDMVTLTPVTGQIGTGQDFDGTADWVDSSVTGLISGVNPYTFEMWIEPDTCGDDTLLKVFDGTSVEFNLCPNGTGDLGIWHGAGNEASSATGEVSIGSSSWQHVAGVYNGSGTVTFYVNGAATSMVDSSLSEFSTTGAMTLSTNSRNTPAEFYDGGMDEVRVSNTNRSADWLEASYISASDSMNTFGSQEDQTGGGGAGTELTDFPVLISLMSDSALSTNAQADGDDILFTASDGYTKLAHEIESYSSGTLVAWVKVPTIYTQAETKIFMYYGNGSVGSQENPSSVWDSNYNIVYHMDGSGTTTISDSAGTAQNGTKASTTDPNPIAGQINGAQDFDGTNDRITTSSPSLPTGDFTYEGWFRGDTSVGDHILGARNSAGGTDEISLQYDSNTVDVYTNSTFRFNSSSISTGTTFHFVLTRSGSSLKLYINGSSNATGSDGTAMSFGTCPFVLGAENTGTCGSPAYGNFMNGLLDEVRVSSMPRSADWISLGYDNQNDPAAFHAVGSQEIYPYAPLNSELMRHGKFFDSRGAEQPFAY